MMAEDSLAVVLLVAERVEAELPAAGAESASADQHLVVVQATTIAEACIPWLREPASCALRFVDRLLLQGRITS
jgi:hypothetical protein